MWPFGESNKNEVDVNQHIEVLHLKSNSTIIVIAIIIVVAVLYKAYKNMRTRILRDAQNINQA